MRTGESQVFWSIRTQVLASNDVIADKKELRKRSGKVAIFATKPGTLSNEILVTMRHALRRGFPKRPTRTRFQKSENGIHVQVVLK